MTTISNKSRAPLSIPLPRGKTLHIGPGKTAEISATAVDHPKVKKLLDSGEIEIVGEGRRTPDRGGAGKRQRPWTQAHASTTTGRSSGDR